MAKKPTRDEDEDNDPKPRRSRSEEDGEGGEGEAQAGLRFDIKQRTIALKEWAIANKIKAGIIGGVALLLIFAAMILYSWRAASIRNRPTLPMAITALEAGQIPAARQMAESLLKYAEPDDKETRGGALFVLGICSFLETDVSISLEKEPFYLIAAGYLDESRQIGYPEGRETIADYFLGKSFYMGKDYAHARPPLERALEGEIADKKTVYWYLANACFKDADADFALALKYCDLFRQTRPIDPGESHAASLLRIMILLRQGDTRKAQLEMQGIPENPEYSALYHFTQGQIYMEQGRELRDRAHALEQQYAIPPQTDIFPEPDMDERTNIGAMGEPDASSMNLDEIDGSGGTPLPELDPDDGLQPLPFPSGRRTMPENGPERANSIHIPAGGPNRFLAVYQDPFDPNGEMFDPGTPVDLDNNENSTRNDFGETVSEQARRLRLESLKKYELAIREFGNTQRSDTGDLPWTAISLLLEGMSYEEMGRFDEAFQIYRGLKEGYPESSEAISAIFLEADLRERLGDMDAALKGFREAFLLLGKSNSYANPWLKREEMERRAQEVFARRLAANKYAEAFVLLKVLENVIPGGRTARLCAVGLQQWAEWLEKRSAVASFDQREKILIEAREKFKLAGQWYRELARWEYTTERYVDDIWYSAEAYRRGRDYLNAIPMYFKYLELDPISRRPRTLVYLGEMYFELDLLPQAAEMIGECLELYPERMISYYASLLGSYIAMEQKNYAKAKSLLERNLAGILGPEAPEYRDSLFALGRLYYKQGDYENAIYSLEDAITLHPNAIQVAHSHYLIAMGYFRMVRSAQAETESVLPGERQSILNRIAGWRTASISHLRKAKELVSLREDALNLTLSEQKMLRNCYFAIGALLMELGPNYYTEAREAYEQAATRYLNLPESLEAMIQIARIYRFEGEDEKAREIVERARNILERLTAAGAFPPGQRFSSADWDELIKWQQGI